MQQLDAEKLPVLFQIFWKGPHKVQVNETKIINEDASKRDFFGFGGNKK